MKSETKAYNKTKSHYTPQPDILSQGIVFQYSLFA